MSERGAIRRVLLKNTLVFFAVFAVLFSAFGVLVFRSVGEGIYLSADGTLEEMRPQPAEEAGAADAEEGGSFDEAAGADAEAGGFDDGDEAAAQEAAGEYVSANPQLVYLVRKDDGSLADMVGLYLAYPEYLTGVAFDAGRIDQVYEASAGGHRYRGINYALEGDPDGSYLQVLVNVDAEVAILSRFAGMLAAYLVLAVAVSAAASWMLSRRTLRPLFDSQRRQTEFVQNASHELRTPLAVIRAKQELLLKRPNDRVVDRLEDIDVAIGEAKRLSKLVEDLMQLSMDDAGRTPLAKRPVDLDRLVQRACAAYGDLFEAAGKRLSFVPGGVGTVDVDPDRIRQLLGILLDNAAKYTEPGEGATVSTRLRGGRVVLEVADTGCGVGEEDARRAFDRFYRADRARSRETGGNGLGLSLALGIVEAHRGRIAMTSNEPKGTVVTAVLPR